MFEVVPQTWVIKPFNNERREGGKRGEKGENEKSLS